ncbi:MAG: response regulator [Candidatus Omnitrophota bacterium]
MAKKILIIDDDLLILKSLTSVFIRDGWDVETCQDGDAALGRIAKEIYQCVLLDIRMPGLDGTQIMSSMRAAEAKQPGRRQHVVVMTGYADENAIVRIFGLGASDYIQKPFDVQELLKKANACLNAEEFISGYGRVEQEGEADGKTFKKIRKNYDFASILKKAELLEKEINVRLTHIRGCTYNTEFWKGNIENPIGIAQIPLGLVGPIAVKGKHAQGEFWVPMATTEGALTLTYDLGSRLLSMAGPVEAEVISKVVHISPMFPIISDEDKRVAEFIDNHYEEIKKVAEADSHHTKLLGIERHHIKNQFVLKFKYDTGDAHGLNMINHATFYACKYIQAKTGADFYHRSHYSGVKHHSWVNENEGYGRVVKARGIVCQKALGMLGVSAKKMKDFFDRCVQCGTAAEIKSVNVHAANGLAAIFIACGQDVADLSSAHTCATTVEIAGEGKDLLIQVELKNLLIATVGGGTGLGTQSECLNIMDCLGSGKSDKFAEIIAAIVLAGEFPTAAAVINETYVDIHDKYGRNKSKIVK